MNPGAVMFAQGTGHDYVTMAVWNARRIRDHLGIPVSVITDQDIQDPVFDRVIKVSSSQHEQRWFPDINAVVPWHNHLRCEALELTPYDRTLLLDVDFVVSSDRLRTVLDHGADIMCFRTAYDVSTGQDLEDLNYFGSHRMPMWWATVVVFGKTAITKFVFDAWRMVRDNWPHYRDVYQIRDPLYRNDYAMTIALGIVSGHTLKVDTIPWRLPTIMPHTEFALNTAPWSEFQIFYRDAQDRRRTQNVFSQTDCHVMAKSQLLEVVRSAA